MVTSPFLTCTAHSGVLYLWESSLMRTKTPCLRIPRHQISITQINGTILFLGISQTKLWVSFLSQPGLNCYHCPRYSALCSIPRQWASFSILSVAGLMDLQKREFRLKRPKSTTLLTWMPSLWLLLWTQTFVSLEEKTRWGFHFSQEGNSLLEGENVLRESLTLHFYTATGLKVWRLEFKPGLCHFLSL